MIQEFEAPSPIEPDKPETLFRAIDTFRVYCGLVLLSFSKFSQDLPEMIERNFIARGMNCTRSIYAVWNAGSEQDAWILHRSLVDRLLHLHYLGKTHSFSEFEEYSFLSMYEARNKLMFDPSFSSRIPKSLKELQKSEEARYKLLVSKKSRWHRPKAQEIAKQMNLGFIYNLGYDYASMHVHPMSDDGDDDFKWLTESPDKHILPDATLVRNSIAI